MRRETGENTKVKAEGQPPTTPSEPESAESLFTVALHKSIAKTALSICTAADEVRSIVYGGAKGGVFEGLEAFHKALTDCIAARKVQKLSTQLGVNCQELAKIIVSAHRAKLGRHLPESPARDAAFWLQFAAKGHQEHLRPGGRELFTRTLDRCSDVEGAKKAIRFFLRLAEHLRQSLASRLKAMESPNWLWTLIDYWPPKRSCWPGLAYFQPAARLEFLCLRLGDQNAPSKKTLENCTRRKTLTASERSLVSSCVRLPGKHNTFLLR